MTINRLNYEVFFIDYLDGRLSPSLVAELLSFLDQNSDIKNELDGIKDAVLIGETTVFPNKIDLKKKSFLKNGIDNEFEYLCISSVEGSITNDENEVFDKIVQEDPNKQNQYLTFQKALINPNTTIVYPNKSRLKRTSIIPIRHSTLRLSISVAASISLIIGLYTIGRLILSDNPLENYSKSNFAKSAILPVKITDEAKKTVVDVKKSVWVKPKDEEIVEHVQVDTKEKNERIDLEESIPNTIHRIELKQLSVKNNPQIEQLAQIVAKYASSNQIQYEDRIGPNDNKTKEIGVFEVIQYGVQSFGKFVGRDINLKANKDKKGNIEKISFESNLIAFSTPVNKNK